jgi:hypothetical protein
MTFLYPILTKYIAIPEDSEAFVFKYLSYRNIPRHTLKIKFIAVLPLKYV